MPANAYLAPELANTNLERTQMTSDDPRNSAVEQFSSERLQRIQSYGRDHKFRSLSAEWLTHAFESKYMYNFTSLGRPIIQTPVDMVAIQELIWSVRPDLVIEVGIAHGGSLLLSASMLALLDYCDAAERGIPLDPNATRRRVLGVDIEIRPHNRAAIEGHPLAHFIEMIQGSSISPDTIAQVHERSKRYRTILVILDSNHTHEHVLAELEAYAPLTSMGSYCVVFDTIVEDLPASMFPDRPWGKGDNPKTAVREYLRQLHAEGRLASDGTSLCLAIDDDLENKLMLTVAPGGYLRRIEKPRPSP